MALRTNESFSSSIVGPIRLCPSRFFLPIRPRMKPSWAAVASLHHTLDSFERTSRDILSHHQLQWHSRLSCTSHSLHHISLPCTALKLTGRCPPHLLAQALHGLCARVSIFPLPIHMFGRTLFFQVFQHASSFGLFPIALPLRDDDRR
jgi:hypothetical protein